MSSPSDREPDESTTAARPASDTEPVPPPPDKAEGTTAVRRAVSDRTAPLGPPSGQGQPPASQPTARWENHPGSPASTRPAAPAESASRRGLLVVGMVGALIIALAAGAIWFAVNRSGGGEQDAGPVPKGPQIPPVTAAMIAEATDSLSGGPSTGLDPGKSTSGLDLETATESTGP